MSLENSVKLCFIEEEEECLSNKQTKCVVCYILLAAFGRARKD